MNIPKTKTIAIYELTCVVEPEYSQAELDKVAKELEAVITKNKGKLKTTESWGKKDLAYLLKKAGKSYRQANFLHFVFELDSAHATQLKDEINIVDVIIRYLLVKQEAEKTAAKS